MKRILPITLGLLYLAALLFSLVMLFKSGAAFFYLKETIPPQAFTQNGAAYAFPFRVNYTIYDPKSLIILEDQKLLPSTNPKSLAAAENGAFALEGIGGGQITVLISPTGRSNPANNGHVYQVYIRPYLISSNHGGFYALVLLAGLAAFLAGSLSHPSRRKVLLGSPLGFWKVWRSLLDAPRLNLSARKTQPSARPPAALWLQAGGNLILAAYFYVLMEWVFFVTKPSFMDNLNLGEKLKILSLNGFVLALFALLTLAVFFLADRVLSPVFPAFSRYARHIPAALLSACLVLILVDNFTYTVFKFGIVDSTGAIRLGYALGILGVFRSILIKMAGAEKTGRAGKAYPLLAAGLMGVSLILAGFTYRVENQAGPQSAPNQAASKTPNILFLSSDGVNANNMSVYGYARPTTPFIIELAKTSLLSQNHFTNSGHTLGSTASILTGKLPLATRLLYPPDILKGLDQFQHLPGLLKDNGYRTVQLGIPYYVDANYANFQGAFDSVNCEENTTNNLTSVKSGIGFNNEFYFLTTYSARILDRTGHIFFLKDMENPYTFVTVSKLSYLDDQNRIGCLLNYLEDASRASQPLFAQVHLMGTHGELFYPSARVFSKGEEQTEFWMTDFYDDAILDFDAEVKQIVNALKDLGQYQNTILVLYSDHGQRFVTSNRVPLIIHFPGDAHSGTLTNNTQIIDVPPTILDYMGLSKPAWMAGDSLLESYPPDRLILGTKTNQYEMVSGTNLLVEAALKPPFYQFSELTVLQCQNLFDINLADLTMVTKQVEGYIQPCPPDRLDSSQAIRRKVGDILAGLGYTLPNNW